MKLTNKAKVKLEYRCGYVMGASCRNTTLTWQPGDGRHGTHQWVLSTDDCGTIRRIRLSLNELDDLAAIMQAVTNRGERH